MDEKSRMKGQQQQQQQQQQRKMGESFVFVPISYIPIHGMPISLSVNIRFVSSFVRK